MKNEKINNGKFKTADELLSAYNALEREFTRRCQLIKELQAATADTGEKDSGPEAQADIEKCDSAGEEDETAAAVPDGCDTAAPEPQAQEQIPTTRDIAPDILNEIAERPSDYVEALSAIPEVMDACIARYKKSLIGVRVSASPRGMAVIVPAKRPKTLADAKAIADELLK